MKWILLTLALLSTLFLPAKAFAQDLPTLTIVNPIRGPQLGLEKADLLSSLQGQWAATKEASVSATWLWQYSALETQSLVTYAKENLKNQEFGLFLEIDKNTAEKAGVDYKGTLTWYHSDGLLLPSYDIFERERLIDSSFTKFNQTFGYYPKSVGAWWVGAQSINYMKQKYNISAVLQCADQFNTDAYSLWGTPWSIPYVPSKTNAAIPTHNNADSTQVVMMQWAPRDPLNGYGKGVEDSTFSLQDYQLKGYNLTYFSYLREIYAKQKNDQLVFGLESGLPAEAYQGQYKLQDREAYNLTQDKKAKIQTMEEFARQFLDSKQILPPSRYFLTKDFNSNDQSFWYHSNKIRLAIQKKGNIVQLVDLRDYENTDQEDFYTVPNTQRLLRIETHAIVDSVRKPESAIKIGEYTEPLAIKETNEEIQLLSGDNLILIASLNKIELPPIKYVYDTSNSKNKISNMQNIIIQLKANYLIRKNSIVHTLQYNFEQSFNSKKSISILMITVYLLLGTITSILMLFYLGQTKLAYFTVLLGTVFVINWIYISTQEASRIILTPFENAAIQNIKTHKKNVVFLKPHTQPIYRAVRPLFFYDPHYLSYLMDQPMRIVSREQNSIFDPQIKTNETLVIPKYLGEDLYPSEIESMKLTKMYDNAQIAIYEPI